MSESTQFEVSAQPYKRFFIDIITRDPDVIDTIPEFVDNSIDGAIRQADGDDYRDFRAEIDLTADTIEITDNCGGITRELAEDYAFRFGRPETIEDDQEYVIGEFGVGMKRSIFKLGQKFIVESNPVDEERFIIEEDLNEWVNEGEEEEGYDAWTFVGENIDQDDPRCELRENGTRVYITDLNSDAKEEFEDPLFSSRLKERLVSDFQKFLNNGFAITVNNESLDLSEIEILQSDKIDTAYKQRVLHENGSEVEVEITAGLGESDPEAAGWYVYCNGRLVLEADQTEKTGWSGKEIPKFHNQFNRFRGFVNFKSDDLGALPWNTSKTDINGDSSVYRTTKQEMISVMRPIIDFLNDVRQEQRRAESGDDEITPLEQAIDNADVISVDELDNDEDSDFSAPEAEDVEEPQTTIIRYERDKDKVREMKDELGVSTNSAVGRETFEYYYREILSE